eukprot:CAMPEP_0172576856 /NCGR_PEP_ID=MMETSP1067-20121228/137939_1 /TAXON_ID=265564 ORGANISM="Thalassiosira punctigera, Strain Tpunct2005C2" /NCGR_SAMPLE_ID=MMETSP1067 /ASSEMBLY_ACC=CAM_ASM_000444 /LENGTH=100 /DNA_ID=CAMNT_0013369535 /DNA_START=494 /DNA_END=793 /DNA_ORIENTATION=+
MIQITQIYDSTLSILVSTKTSQFYLRRHKHVWRLDDEEIKKLYGEGSWNEREKFEDISSCMHFECDWDLTRCAPSAADGSVVLEDYYRPDATSPPCCNDL